MKTSLLFATALAVSSFASSASALDIGHVFDLRVSGIGVSLGVLGFTPLGADGRFCDYLANWYSPFNPNDVGICIVQELRTPFAPSCIVNERANVVTVLQSGPLCTGFNLKGESFPNTALLLSESAYGLSGVVVISDCGIAQTYPVSSC